MNMNVQYLYISKNKFPIELYAGSLIKQNISMINLISCEEKNEIPEQTEAYSLFIVEI